MKLFEAFVILSPHHHLELFPRGDHAAAAGSSHPSFPNEKRREKRFLILRQVMEMMKIMLAAGKLMKFRHLLGR